MAMPAQVILERDMRRHLIIALKTAFMRPQSIDATGEVLET